MGDLVLDASALLAYLQDEPGAEVVADALAGGGTAISSVNLGEALGRVADHGVDPAALAERLTSTGLLESAIAVEPFTIEDAIETARLRPLTRRAGLSFADRACLALALRLEAAALTADRAWRNLPVAVEVRQIR